MCSWNGLFRYMRTVYGDIYAKIVSPTLSIMISIFIPLFLLHRWSWTCSSPWYSMVPTVIQLYIWFWWLRKSTGKRVFFPLVGEWYKRTESDFNGNGNTWLWIYKNSRNFNFYNWWKSEIFKYLYKLYDFE